MLLCAISQRPGGLQGRRHQMTRTQDEMMIISLLQKFSFLDSIHHNNGMFRNFALMTLNTLMYNTV
jgi:hypothetical protein